MSVSLSKTLVVSLAVALTLSACGKKATDDASGDLAIDVQEAGQQIGDLMASIDESHTGGGNLAQVLKSEAKLFARHAPGSLSSPSPLQAILFPTATATACSAVGYGACTSGVAVRSFGGCTVGSATFSGDVTMTYTSNGVASSTCRLSADLDRSVRSPNYTVTGLRGATLTVSKTGTYGQEIFRIGPTTIALYNDGIRRVFSLAGTTILDSTTILENNDSSTGMTMNQLTRNGRVLSGGKLTVTNNLNQKSCSFEPNAVTWGSSCNCPTSGSWSGTCSDDSTSTVELTGCGTATVTIGDKSEDITMDRCY